MTADTKHPDFFKIPAKIQARMEIVKNYRLHFKKKSIPIDRQYWCLCGLQPNTPGAEIVQLSNSHLFRKSQFHGVDMNPDKYQFNKEAHPDANWHLGEWTEVIRKSHFDPAIIYLDTTSFANKPTSWDLVGSTLPLCREKTMLFANVMLNDSRSRIRFDKNDFVRGLIKTTPDLELIRWEIIRYYEYSSTRSTKMGTFILVKNEII